jgi:hypothetical protein
MTKQREPTRDNGSSKGIMTMTHIIMHGTKVSTIEKVALRVTKIQPKNGN